MNRRVRAPQVRRRRRLSVAAISCRTIATELEPTMALEKPDAVMVMLPASLLRRVYEAALNGMP